MTVGRGGWIIYVILAASFESNTMIAEKLKKNIAEELKIINPRIEILLGGYNLVSLFYTSIFLCSGSRAVRFFSLVS